MKDERGRELALAHWNYIRGLMTMHGIDAKTMEMVEFHYITAMEHGYKHGLKNGIKMEKSIKRLARKL